MSFIRETVENLIDENILDWKPKFTKRQWHLLQTEPEHFQELVAKGVSQLYGDPSSTVQDVIAAILSFNEESSE